MIPGVGEYDINKRYNLLSRPSSIIGKDIRKNLSEVDKTPGPGAYKNSLEFQFGFMAKIGKELRLKKSTSTAE